MATHPTFGRAHVPRRHRTTVAIMHAIHAASAPKFLSAITDDSPCDGTHGLFCPECASINRWREREEALRCTRTAT